jgi:uncharacterized membrane protein YadS
MSCTTRQPEPSTKASGTMMTFLAPAGVGRCGASAALAAEAAAASRAPARAIWEYFFMACAFLISA